MESYELAAVAAVTTRPAAEYRTIGVAPVTPSSVPKSPASTSPRSFRRSNWRK